MAKRLTIEVLINDDADDKAVQDELSTLLHDTAEHNPDTGILGWRLPERQNVAVVMDGGIVQAVVAERPEDLDNINLVLIDYDTDGAAGHELISVPQGEEEEDVEAYMRQLSVDKSGIDLDTAYSRFLEQAESEETRFTTGMR